MSTNGVKPLFRPSAGMSSSWREGWQEVAKGWGNS